MKKDGNRMKLLKKIWKNISFFWKRTFCVFCLFSFFPFFVHFFSLLLFSIERFSSIFYFSFKTFLYSHFPHYIVLNLPLPRCLWTSSCSLDFFTFTRETTRFNRDQIRKKRTKSGFLFGTDRYNLLYIYYETEIF